VAVMGDGAPSLRCVAQADASASVAQGLMEAAKGEGDMGCVGIRQHRAGPARPQLPVLGRRAEACQTGVWRLACVGV
jgi:hypothetical protein